MKTATPSASAPCTLGALALARGISGRCEAKRVLQEVGEQAQNAVIDSSHMPLEQTPAEREAGAGN
mgnify:CR=1 FL=1